MSEDHIPKGVYTMKKHVFSRFLPFCLALILLASIFASCSSGNASMDEALPNAPTDQNGAAGGVEMEKPSEGGNGYLNGDYERKVIRTVNMTCETKAYDDAISVIMSALSSHGGFVEASSATGTGYDDVRGSERRATYTFRVPAEKLDAFLEALRVDEGIRVLSQSATSNEITAAYYDTVSRLETLNAEKTSLTAMLEGFTDYSDISAMLQVQERLYNVIEEIEALQTQLNLYDGQVAMSTVHLTLSEVITYTEVVVAEPTFGERISKAFRESWADFAEGCQDFAVWFVEAFPTILVLAVIGGIVLTVVLILNRKSEARRRAARERMTSANPVPPYRPNDPGRKE